MTPQLIEHFRNPRNVGELPPPAIAIEADNPICGDILRLCVLADSGRIQTVRYKVRGCTASIAAGSALTELLTGADANQVKALSTADIESALGGLPNESRHAAALCLDGVRKLRTALGW